MLMKSFAAVRHAFQHSSPKMIDLDDPKFTPDWWRLSTYTFQNIFLCNHMMKGCEAYQEHMEGRSIKRSAAFTQSSNFVMWKRDLGKYTQAVPFRILEDQMTGPSFNRSSYYGKPMRILGHVYLVDPLQVSKLDTELQNGVMYKRERITVEVPYRRKTGKYLADMEIVTVPVWAWVANPDYWAELMNPARCSPVKSYQKDPDGEPYYFYSEKNEQNHR